MNIKARLLAAGREILAAGLVAGTWGNLSVRDPDQDGFWITPSGMDYRLLQEQDLVLLTYQGEVKEGFRKPSSEYLLHSTIYNKRPDVQGIVHTHSVYATAHAVARISIPGIVEDLVQIAGGSVDTALYKLLGTQELAYAAVAGLGEKNAVLLANHGLVGVGKSLEEALKVCHVVEKAAQIHTFSRLLGNPVVLSDEDIQTMRTGYLHSYGQR